MVDPLSRLAKLAEKSVALIDVRSALNSPLWLSGVTCPVGLVGAIFAEPPVHLFMVGFMFIAPITAAAGFAYFALTDPDKLRSESYELRKTALSMIEEKGGNIPLEAASVEAIANIEYSPKAIIKKPGDNDK